MEKMPETFRPDDIRLVPMDVATLRRLAASEPAGLAAARGALPPAHVAALSLSQFEAGVPASWCLPYLIVSTPSGEVLGGCRFKGAPNNGRVSIGYGVAGSARRRGVATAAVGHLLRIAASSGLVRQVDAQILPDNLASSAVVSRLGFIPAASFVDTDGERVVQWTYRIAA